jgi:uncharacterized protein YukE
LGSGIRKNSEVGGNGCQTYGTQMSYDICYHPPTLIFKLDRALVWLSLFSFVLKMEPSNMRLRQDLLGCANRIRAASNDWSEQSKKLQEVWRDDRGEAFVTERLDPAEARLQKLVHALQAAGELAQQFDKKLFDPGME